MCARGGGGLSVHNAGLAVRSIGSGGSQPEPRHGCLRHLHDAFEGVATTHCRAFTRPPGLSFTTGRPCSIPMLSLLASLHHDILNHDTTTHPSTFLSLLRGTALHEPTGLTPPIKLPRCTPCASLTTFVVLRRISHTQPPTQAIIQPYRSLCAQTNTNPSAFSSLSRGTALHEPTGLTPPIKLARCALRVANHFRCAATHLSDATAHPSHHSAVPLTLRANQRKPWCLLQPLARHGPQ